MRILFYVIPLVMGLVYWLAFFPGIMSYDSLNQWDQIATFNINNMHPAIHTILMWLLTRFWYSPAIISLFQVIIASLVIGYGLASIQSISRLPIAIFLVLAFLISANPLVGVMDVTIWKDILYGFLVLLLSIFTFNIVSSDGKWISRPWHFIIFGVTLAGVWLIRFNGVPVVIASLLVIIIVYKKHIKHFAYASLITIAIILFIIGPLYSLFKVNRALNYNYGIALIHPVAAYVNSNTGLNYLTDYERGYLNQIYPLDKPWQYSCYDATIFYFQGANFIPVMNDPYTMTKIFTRLATADPKIMIHHFACLSSFVWQLNQPKNVYLETILFDNYNLHLNPAWEIYEDTIAQHSLFPAFRGLVRHIVEAEWRRDTPMLLWRPALYTYLFLAGLVFFAIKVRFIKWLLLSIPLLAQTLGIMLTAQIQALRYQYPVYLIAMLFTVPLIIAGYKKSRLVQPGT